MVLEGMGRDRLEGERRRDKGCVRGASDRDVSRGREEPE